MSAAGVSVVIPVHERAESLAALYGEVAPALAAAGIEAEFIFVAGPGREGTTGPLHQLAHSGAPVRLLDVAQPQGAAMLTLAGAEAARHDRILLLPAYPRVEPAGLPALIDRLGPDCDAAFAARVTPDGGAVGGLARRLFHSAARPITRGAFRDLGSGVAVFHRQTLFETPFYGDFFRFLPILMLREGFRVTEVPVPQHPGDRAPSLHGPGTYLRSAVDLLGMYFLARFTERPLRFFGLLGALLSLAGLAVLGVLLVQRLQGVGIANRPALLLGTLLLALGIQAIALGLVAEIIVHLNAPARRPYRLARPSRSSEPGG